MASVNDSYTNAVIGKLVKVSRQNERHDGYGLAKLECDEWFGKVIVRAWVSNPEDAMMLMDRNVLVYDATLYPSPV